MPTSGYRCHRALLLRLGGGGLLEVFAVVTIEGTEGLRPPVTMSNVMDTLGESDFYSRKACNCYSACCPLWCWILGRIDMAGRFHLTLTIAAVDKSSSTWGDLRLLI